MLTLTGRQEFPLSAGELWDILMNPAALRRSLPGCEDLRVVEEGVRYAVRVRVGVGVLKGRFRGVVELRDLVAPQTCSLVVEGSGATASVNGTTRVALEPLGAGGSTELVYQSDLVIGGAVAAVGSSTLRSAAQKYLEAFFMGVARFSHDT